jgi:hypothetical protein
VRLVYAETYQCDACGDVAHVKYPATASLAEMPTPAGWLIADLMVRRDSGRSLSTVDICSSCAARPLGEVLSALAPPAAG